MSDVGILFRSEDKLYLWECYSPDILPSGQLVDNKGDYNNLHINEVAIVLVKKEPNSLQLRRLGVIELYYKQEEIDSEIYLSLRDNRIDLINWAHNLYLVYGSGFYCRN